MTGALGEFSIIGKDRSATSGGDYFIAIETETRDVAERADFSFPVFSAKRLGLNIERMALRTDLFKANVKQADQLSLFPEAEAA